MLSLPNFAYNLAPLRPQLSACATPFPCACQLGVRMCRMSMPEKLFCLRRKTSLFCVQHCSP